MSSNPETIETKDGRVFALQGQEPYRRKDGAMTALRIWASPCAVCGALFVVKTPASVCTAADSKAFGSKHCDAHKLSREEATARWSRARIEGTRRKNGAQ